MAGNDRMKEALSTEDSTSGSTGKELSEEEEADKDIQSAEEADTKLEEEDKKKNETETKENDIKEATKKNEDAAKEDKNEKIMIEDKKEVTQAVNILEQPKTYYATINLNVRTGPSTDYDVVGSLKIGESIEATGTTQNSWFQIIYQGKKAYCSGKYLVETKEQVEQFYQKSQTVEEVNNQISQAGEEVSNEAPQAIQEMKNQMPKASGGIIMIGDSRCVQMQEAVQGGGCSWICENSKGYKWLEEVAVGWADPSVGKGTKVVFCLGVNDPGNVRNYADLVNAKAAEWRERGATVYYVSVNPVWENPYTTKEQVENFNNTMPGLLSGVIWIDTYSWLMENGCRIVDGLHYDAPTSVNIFNLIMGSI